MMSVAPMGVPVLPPIRTTAAKRVIEARRHAVGREPLDLRPQAILQLGDVRSVQVRRVFLFPTVRRRSVGA